MRKNYHLTQIHQTSNSTMPVDIIRVAISEGPEIIPGWNYIKAYGPIVFMLGATKYYFRGSMNTWERDCHGKVYIITGGTSGLGAEVARELAMKGAQVILLVRSVSDSWLIDYIDDLRTETNNFMIYAEECDLNSLYSIRKFATNWLDNQPPRRLDAVICLAAESIPIGKSRQVSIDGIEKQLAVNYLGHYHLITLLAPSLRSQPPDRDVRVLLATCASQGMGEIDLDDLLAENKRYQSTKSLKVYGTSKLLLSLFGKEFQARCNAYERKDKAPTNVKVLMVNPGLMRTPSTRRFLSMGTIWGLLLYILLYPIWYLFLKNGYEAQQSLLFALWSPSFLQLRGGQLIQECKVITPSRKEFKDSALQKSVFDKTEQLVAKLEKQSAIERKRQAKVEEMKKPKEQRMKEAKERHLADLRKKQDIHEKPQSTDDLESKLNYLRQLIHKEMPILPTEFPPKQPTMFKGKRKEGK